MPVPIAAEIAEYKGHLTDSPRVIEIATHPCMGGLTEYALAGDETFHQAVSGNLRSRAIT